MTGTQLRFLGELRLEHYGRQVGEHALGGRRGAVLLARLHHGRGAPVHRDDLAAALWDGDLPQTWRSALRNVVTEVRRGMETAGLDPQRVLESTRAGYRLMLPTDSEVDLDEVFLGSSRVEGLLAQGSPSDALERAERLAVLAEAPLLPGEESEFARDLRQQVRSAGVQLSLTSGRMAMALGHPDAAEVAARRMLAVAPLREDAYRLLIRALIATGSSGAALEAYDECRRALADGLGVHPSTETQSLFRELLDIDAATAGSTRNATTTRPAPAGWSLLVSQRAHHFVGRRTEQARLAAEWRDVIATGRVGLVEVVGEAGIGKTALAAEFCASLRGTGVPVLYGRAENRVEVPHRPVLEALETYLATIPSEACAEIVEAGTSALARLLPGVRDVVTPAPTSGLPALDQLHLFREVATALSRIARNGSTGAVLVLDDMQWCRPASEQLVDHLVRQVDGPLLMICLRRPAERAPLAGIQDGHPSLAVPALSAGELVDLASALGRHLKTDDLCALAAESGGNPLYATERLHADAPPEFRESAPRALPTRLQDLVQARVSALPTATGSVLVTAAVAGLEFDPTIVIAASSLPDHVAAAALGVAEGDGILVRSATHRERRAFRHALVRSALLEEVDQATAMEAHRRLGEVMERIAPSTHGTVEDLAHHFERAAPLGDWRRAVRYNRQVAQTSLDHLVLDDAVRSAERALQILDSVGDPEPYQRVDLRIIRGAASRLRGDSDAEAYLEETHRGALALADPVLVARAVLAASLASAGGDDMYLDAARIPVLEGALAGLGDSEPEMRARLLGYLASAYAWTADAQKSHRLAEEALALAREHGEVATLTSVLSARRRSLIGTGRPEDAYTQEEELFTLAGDLEDPLLEARCRLWRFETGVELGHAEDVEHSLRLARPAIEAYAPPADRWSLRYYEAAHALLRGEVERSDRLSVEAADFGAASGVAPLLVDGLRLIQLMGIRHEQGRLAEIRDELAAFFDAAGVPEWRGATAFVDAELGRYVDAAATLDEVFAAYAAAGARTAVGVGLAAHFATPVARLGDTAKAEFLREVLSSYAGRGAFVAYLTCPMDWALGLVAATLGEPEEARRHFRDAAAFAGRVGAARWVERSRRAAETGGLEPPHQA